MPRFSYSAVDRNGGTVRGEIEAASDIEAVGLLEQKGLSVASLDEGGSSLPWWQRDLSIFGASAVLKPGEQAQFFKSVHSMLSSGFTLDRALAFASSRAARPRVKQTFASIADHVNAGGTLASAMESSRGFRDRLTTLVQLGENANQLDTILHRICDMLDIEMRNARQIKQALVYPSVLLLMSVLVVLMLIFFLAPTLVPVFLSAGVSPPALLRTLNRTGEFLVREWPIVLVSTSLIVLAALTFRRTLMNYVSKVIRLLPGLRNFFRTRETLRLLQTLFLMIRSGATLPAALGTASTMASNPYWRVGVEEMRKRVEAGDSLSTAIKASGLADPVAFAFVEAGEESDQLPEMLEQAVRLMDEQSRSQLDQALRLLTPFLTLLIGATVGLLIFITIGAILDLNDLSA